MRKCNCLRAASICCEYFQHRREESYGSAIYREAGGRVALEAHLSPQQLLTLNAIIPQVDLGESLCHFLSPLPRILADVEPGKYHL